MEHPPIRVGIIGVHPDRGWATTAHIPALKQLPEFQLTAVSHHDHDIAVAAARKHNVAYALNTTEELVNHPQVDLVVVSVKVMRHEELVTRAIEMAHGCRSGFALVAGILTGSMTWAILAATGLAAILATYANAMSIIRIIGGMYLLFLAYKSAKSALTASGLAMDFSRRIEPARYGALYRKGLFLHLSNPKAILTWVSLMSLGVQPGVPPHVFPLLLAGSLLLSILIFVGYAVLFSSAPMISAYRRVQRWFDGAVAFFFAYAGLRLLLAKG
jgi:threonine/homoserine/homoserine lactone efflux protein